MNGNHDRAGYTPSPAGGTTPPYRALEPFRVRPFVEVPELNRQ